LKALADTKHYKSLFLIKVQKVSTAQPQEVAKLSANVVNRLATITNPKEGASALPLDLGVTVDVINTVIRYCKML